MLPPVQLSAVPSVTPFSVAIWPTTSSRVEFPNAYTASPSMLTILAPKASVSFLIYTASDPIAVSLSLTEAKPGR